MNTRVRTAIAGAAIVLTGAGLAACGDTDDNTNSSTGVFDLEEIVDELTETVGSDVPASGSRWRDGSNKSRGADELIYDFGETYYGIRGNVTVSEPMSWYPKPSSYLRTQAGKQWLIVTVEVENISNKVQEGWNWTFNATADGRSIYANQRGMGAPDVLPGKTSITRVAMKVPTDVDEVVFSVQYGFFDPMYWTGGGFESEVIAPGDYANPAELAEALGATNIVDSTDRPKHGTEASAEWRGYDISVWMPFDDNDVSYARGVLEEGGYAYAEGDGWFIIADSQEVADAAAQVIQ